ncbi:MAG TPA: alpha/beta fold hydrolase [Planctomicrobium sp.]|nr:alpha/beta fold hydrolase [Planctomicrobium sp.]
MISRQILGVLFGLWLCSISWGAELVDVTFAARVDGTEQRYVLIEPDVASLSPPDLLIALHGHGSDRWQFAKNTRDECRAARDIASRYGMIYVSPDYRAKTSWMGPQAEADLIQIIRELKAKYTINRVFLCGGSMGGSSALTFAALHPELINGVAAMNPTANHLEFQNFQPAIASSFGGTKLEIPDEYKKRSAEYWPERLTMPIGLTTGGNDTVVPPASAQRLADVLQQLNHPVLLIHRKDGGHSTTYEDAIRILEFMVRSSSVNHQFPM